MRIGRGDKLPVLNNGDKLSEQHILLQYENLRETERRSFGSDSLSYTRLRIYGKFRRRKNEQRPAVNIL